MKTDASAAVGILSRQGVGRIKHLQIRQLWIQERLKNEERKMIKIPRNINMSDLMTHHWNERDGLSHMSNLKVIRRGHCKSSAPEGGSKNPISLCQVEPNIKHTGHSPSTAPLGRCWAE